jgi:hypothetical protein
MGGRGGYRKPSKPAATSGPGKFSRRTDGQAVQTPGLADPSIQSGDVQRLEAAQKIAPLPRGVERPPPGQARQMQGAPMQKGGLPSYLFETPTALPGTPDTSGLTTGAGPGPEVLEASSATQDVRELIMQRIYESFGNEEAAQWLIDFRNERAAQMQPSQAGGPSALAALSPPEQVLTPPEGEPV